MNCIAEWIVYRDGILSLCCKIAVTGESLRLVNRMENAHINWQQQRMKIIKTISNSVADAIAYCNTKRLLQATHEFWPHFLIFWNPTILSPPNQHLWQPFLADMKYYISDLKDSTGRRVLESRRKTGLWDRIYGIHDIQCSMHRITLLELVSSKLVK